MNTGAPWQKDETNVENMSAGSYERITAFLIQRVDVKDAKRTFVVGSSGEMGKVIGKKWVNKGDTTLKEDWQIDHWVETAYVDDDYTFDHLQNINPQIETDLLIQAIQGNYMPVFSDFTYQVMASWKYILSNVNIHDAIVVSHWESYVQFIAKKHQSADLFDKDIRHDMRIVNQNIDMLRTIAFYPGTDVVFGSFTSEQLKRLISDRRIYILGRLGHDFEYDVPLNAERAFLEIKQETVSI
jgi:hypothetical protein